MQEQWIWRPLQLSSKRFCSLLLADPSSKEALFARLPVNPKSSLKSLLNSVSGNQKGQSFDLQGVEVLPLPLMSFLLQALTMHLTSWFFVNFPQPIVTKFFCKWQNCILGIEFYPWCSTYASGIAIGINCQT